MKERGWLEVKEDVPKEVGTGWAAHSDADKRQVDVKTVPDYHAEELHPLPIPLLPLPWRPRVPTDPSGDVQ